MREATALLGVSSPTLRRWADAGRVTAWTTPGGHRRFERSALVSLLAARIGSADRPATGRGSAPDDRGLERPAPSEPQAAAWDGAPRPDLDSRLQAPARVLAAALVRCVQADPAARPHAVGAAQAVAAEFVAAGRRLGVPPDELLAHAHALRRRILEALAAGARMRDLAASDPSELLVEAVEVLDPVLERLMSEEGSRSNPDHGPEPLGRSAPLNVPPAPPGSRG